MCTFFDICIWLLPFSNVQNTLLARCVTACKPSAGKQFTAYQLWCSQFHLNLVWSGFSSRKQSEGETQRGEQLITGLLWPSLKLFYLSLLMTVLLCCAGVLWPGPDRVGIEQQTVSEPGCPVPSRTGPHRPSSSRAALSMQPLKAPLFLSASPRSFSLPLSKLSVPHPLAI